MYKYSNYRHLKVDHVYRFFNSMNESFLFHFRGYHYEEEHQGIVLIFWHPGTSDLAAEWHENEFRMAIDDREAQLTYHLLSESVAVAMICEGLSLVVALLNYENYCGRSAVSILHEAGISMKEFRSDIQSRVCSPARVDDM